MVLLVRSKVRLVRTAGRMDFVVSGCGLRFAGQALLVGGSRVTGIEIRLQSDATRFKAEGPCLLVHVLSDTLTWGLGFTQAIEARWPSVAQDIPRRLRATHPRPALGHVLWTPLDACVVAAHLIAERGRGNPESALDLAALSTCLDQVAERVLRTGATVHAPPIGTGLCGARWSDVQLLLESRLVARHVRVVVHCLGRVLPQ